MKTIEEAALEYSDKHKHKVNGSGFILRGAFRAGIEFAQQYINVEDDLPDANIQDEEGIFYSEYLLIKVKGFEHPFVGYYVKANDDDFFDFIQHDLDEWIKPEDIISWKYIEIK